ncbi:SAM-dependent methyltransferase [Deferribacter thermophilus]|uniref:16S rRNA (cytidine(1402)-2'-O)-methyltransferase n=1 Tax=Deferribacter thermophilus TaxID=53573 RepID=UPI003C1A0DEF
MNTLYVLATPLSQQFDQLPQYQIEILKNTDLFIGEEKRFIHRLLAFLDKRDAKYIQINEHSKVDDLLFAIDLILEHKNAVLFSDVGTPAVADPGFNLIDLAYKKGIKVLSLPGPSSITTALSVSGFYAERFYFAGFPPKKEPYRRRFLKKIADKKETVVLMERPYTLEKILKELQFINRRVSISFNLGLKDEITIRGKVNELLEKTKDFNKIPFVIVIEGGFNERKFK